ncbi:hypothetical protein D3C85_1771750 [compost metagenome]
MPFDEGFLFFYTQSTQCNTLIDLNIVTNDSRFANYDSGSMVDGKIITYLCSGMNFDTGFDMSIF